MSQEPAAKKQKISCCNCDNPHVRFSKLYDKFCCFNCWASSFGKFVDISTNENSIENQDTEPGESTEEPTPAIEISLAKKKNEERKNRKDV